MLKKYGLKLSLVLMIAIVVVVGVVLVATISATSKLVSHILEQQSTGANNAFAEALQSYRDDALKRAEMIAASEEVAEAVAGRNHAKLVKALGNFSEGFDLITLCDAGGVVLARSHSDQTGDSVLNQQAISTALSTGKGISTIETGTVIGISTRGSAAIKDQNGRIIGALTCGHDLSQSKYVDQIKSRHGCEVTFFAGDERMSTTIVDEQGNRVIGTKAGDAVVVIYSNLKVLNAMLHALENVGKWRQLPKKYGKWNSIYKRVNRWAKDGVLERVFEFLHAGQVTELTIDALSLDGTIIKVHPDGCGAEKKTGNNA